LWDAGEAVQLDEHESIVFKVDIGWYCAAGPSFPRIKSKRFCIDEPPTGQVVCILCNAVQKIIWFAVEKFVVFGGEWGVGLVADDKIAVVFDLIGCSHPNPNGLAVGEDGICGSTHILFKSAKAYFVWLAGEVSGKDLKLLR